MDSPSTPPAEAPQIWYVGLHDSKNVQPMTEESLRAAQHLNYDMTTTPITTPHFQAGVQSLLSTYHSDLLDKNLSRNEIPIPLVPALQPKDSPLIPHEAISQLLAVTSPWIDLASSDPVVADVSRQVLNLELAYASFCGVQNVVIPGPILPDGTVSTGGLTQFARSMQEALDTGMYLQIHVLLPMYPSRVSIREGDDSSHLSKLGLRDSSKPDAESKASDQWATWEAWNLVRRLCNYSTRIGIALSIPKQLPCLTLQSRWYSEPLRLLFFPESCFIPNKYSQPVLSKSHQALLSRYMRLRNPPWIVLGDVSPVPATMTLAGTSSSSTHPESEQASTSVDPTPHEASMIASQRISKSLSADPAPHLSYIRALQRKQPPKPPIERFGAGYQDYLQMPLQPLADNLESITYEVFEKDPIKYEWYERAITFALLDWATQEKAASSPTGAVVIAVVGAGRGPLVTRALHAAHVSNVNVKVWAVEKNPNAYVLLQRHNTEFWNHRVNVVKSDMRAWKGPTLPDGSNGYVDILVSELLGSFADNELSPECLDGVQHVLNPVDGISIPCSYTPYLTPIATPKLHADVLTKLSADSNVFEVPYVVMLHAYDYLSYEAGVQTERPRHGRRESSPAVALDSTTPSAVSPTVLPCWTFTHPIPNPILKQSSIRKSGSAAGGGGGPTGGGDGSNAHNSRFVRLSFKCPKRGVCHGLAGYFETVLYPGINGEGRVELSTNPDTMDTMSKDMISWFPIWFPLKVPISFPDNSELLVSIWRQTDDRKVWYEWFVEIFATLGDQRVQLGTTELHTSKKSGCLM